LQKLCLANNVPYDPIDLSSALIAIGTEFISAKETRPSADLKQQLDAALALITKLEADNKKLSDCVRVMQQNDWSAVQSAGLARRPLSSKSATTSSAPPQ
jgi:hypothetical protein